MTESAPRLVDTHAHLMDPRLAGELEAVLARARAAGVARMVCVGYDLPTSRAAVELARRWPDQLVATVGIHPNDAVHTTDATFDEIAALAREPGVVGIGETGLDYYRDRTPRARQREALTWHLRLAESRRLPVVIHCRGAAEEELGALLDDSARRRPAGDVPGVLHCFSSSDTAYLDRMLAAGYLVSFAGPVTFRNAGALPGLAARVPADRIVVETDCPYLAPEPRRGRRNEPAYVRYTAEHLAALRDVPFATFAEQLWANSCRLFPALAGTTLGAHA